MIKKTTATYFIVPLVLLSFFLLSVGQVAAFEASSASFEIHAGDIESVAGTSTSATFRLGNGGGQLATGTSTGSTKSVYSGILYWLYGFFIAQYTEGHYRWRNDDGTEVTATWTPNEDTIYNPFPRNTAKRLRFEIANEGWTRGAAPSFTLEFAQLSSGSDCAAGPFATVYTAVPTNYSLHMHLSTSTIVTDATPTTDFAGSLTNENMTFVAGQIKTTGNTTAAITLPSDSFTEVEYGVSATSLATGGATYCFRLNDNLTPSRMVYSQYAKVQLASGLAVSGSLDSAVFDTFTTTGAGQGPAYNSIMWKGTEGTGKVRFQFATSESASGAWSFIGGPTCGASDWYDTGTSGVGGGPGVPVEISCSPTNHNNQRYYRYRIQLCSLDCSASGVTSPVVSDVVVNFAP